MAIRQVTRAGVGLAVGIIILAALVFGGLWLVRERGEQARREEAISIADQQLQEESNEGVALNEGQDQPASSESGDAAQPAPTETSPAPATTPDTPAPAAAEELPQTGPEFGSVVGIGLLGFVIVSFIRSRKLVNGRS